jgi:co-chaperonin GroES (HSP10)
MRARVIIPQSAQDAGRGMMAEVWVMAVGDHAYFNHGGEWESPVQVGDRALTRGVNAFSTHKAAGSDIVWEVLPFDAIVALVNEDSVPTIPETRSIGGAV